MGNYNLDQRTKIKSDMTNNVSKNKFVTYTRDIQKSLQWITLMTNLNDNDNSLPKWLL